MAKDVGAIMQSIPAGWRNRWCGGENGPCACVGCVQIGNRLIMTGLKVHQVDPEYINEAKIPKEIYDRFKITKLEWETWRHKKGEARNG